MKIISAVSRGALMPDDVLMMQAIPSPLTGKEKGVHYGDLVCEQ